MLKETEFFLATFKKNRNDRSALTVAKKINCFLDVSEDWKTINDALAFLDEYVPVTKSETFLWELVYIRRKIVDIMMDDYEDPLVIAGQYRIQADYFSHVVRVNPSLYNRYVEVNSLCNASAHFDKAMDNDTADALLVKAYELYEKIPPKENKKHHETGERLYLNMLLCCKAPNTDKELKAQLYRKMIKASRFLYVNNGDIESLKLVILGYLDCFSNRFITYEEEKEDIDQVVLWAQKELDEGADVLKEPLRKLRRAILWG